MSVICKAATADIGRVGGLTGLGDTGVRERLRQLLDERSNRRTGPARTALNALAAAMAACTLLLCASVPAAAVAGLSSHAHSDHHYHHCHPVKGGSSTAATSGRLAALSDEPVL